MTPGFPAPIELHRFADSAALAQALAQAVASDLRNAIDARGHAALAVSGGNTPRLFLQALSVQRLDWSRVGVTLVDERWVPESSARSNAALVRAQLLQGPASAARFVVLHRDMDTPETALPALELDLGTLPLPLDVAILGMGEDGHTASFFPGGDLLEQALDPLSTAQVLPMRAPGADEPRMTLTLPVLLAAGRLYLHIEGPAKQQVLQQALSAEAGASALPVARVLAQAHAPVQVYWSA